MSKPSERPSLMMSRDPFVDYGGPPTISTEQRALPSIDYKSHEYSFRKTHTDHILISCDKKAENSEERKPVSPISGLNDKMRTIEEKIMRYKNENANFEKRSFPLDNSLDANAQARLGGSPLLSSRIS